MVFSSTEFLFLFLPALVILYYLPCFKQREWRNVILLAFSIGFYAWGEPIFVFLMLFSAFANWAFGLIMDKDHKKKKAWLTVAMAFDVLLLAIFKYVSFLSKNLAFLTGNDKLIVNIALPIGISFFTFQMMSYVLDVYYGNVRAQRNLLYLMLYIILFPQLIAGPIVRYRQIEGEIIGRRETSADFIEGTERFIYGLGKKLLLADYLALIVDEVFAIPQRTIASAWLGAIAYTLQIYFDFSGYSDMAIGLGRIFGFHFAENFNYPYISRSVTEFWRRWHISLSSWFRDYVYIPLGGSRVSRGRWVFNMLVVWILTGIWHGANWTFLCWGLFYFSVIVIERVTKLSKKIGRFSHIYTMLVVMLAWVIFRADTVSAGIIFIGNMVGIGAEGLADAMFFEWVRSGALVIVGSAFLSAPVFPYLRKTIARKSPTLECALRAILCLMIFCLSVIHAVSATYSPFIYFNF